MDTQKIENQKGEIEFRKKLYEQQVKGEQTIENELSSQNIESILQQRMETTRTAMKQLKKQKIVASPYLEIGSERCQRTLVVENDFEQRGAAVDISFDMLKSCEHYSQVFTQKNIPMRICCDANHLPFLSNSFPFIFCYETLHHFPQPQPIVAEIHRVLAPDGYFFFDEEPYKQILHIGLLKGGKMYSEKERNRAKRKGIFGKIIDRFLREKECNEVEHGIIENEDISLNEWKKTLGIFSQKKVDLFPTKSLQTDLFEPQSKLKYFLSYLCGGKIKGLCCKEGEKQHLNIPIEETLMCLECKEREEKLLRSERGFCCPNCNTTYAEKEGVIFLFTREKLNTLYPELAK